MTYLYDGVFDQTKRERLDRAVERTRTAMDGPVDAQLLEILEQWLAVATDAYGLQQEVEDLQILHSTVVEHATGVEEELWRRNEEVSQFLAGMSHEFRTPLNAIIGYSEMALEVAEEDCLTQVTEEIRRIADAGHHMLALTNDVLDLSKVEAGRLELLPERIRAEDVVLGVVTTMEALARDRGNALRVDIDPQVNWILVDPVRLRQCLTNLVGNACKFTENGVIDVMVARHGDWLAFAVRDTGIGMSGAQRERLFRAFVQASATTARDYGGTGLGLALSQRLAQAMGGAIDVESIRGSGSTFTLRLPGSIALAEAR